MQESPPQRNDFGEKTGRGKGNKTCYTKAQTLQKCRLILQWQMHSKMLERIKRKNISDFGIFFLKVMYCF